jgi:hypothetical protein
MGGVSLVDIGDATLIRMNIDSDAEFESEILIEDGSVAANQYTSADFIL